MGPTRRRPQRALLHASFLPVACSQLVKHGTGQSLREISVSVAIQKAETLTLKRRETVLISLSPLCDAVLKFSTKFIHSF